MSTKLFVLFILNIFIIGCSRCETYSAQRNYNFVKINDFSGTLEAGLYYSVKIANEENGEFLVLNIINHTGRDIVIGDNNKFSRLKISTPSNDELGIKLEVNSSGFQIGGTEKCVIIQGHTHRDGSICGWEIAQIIKKIDRTKGQIISFKYSNWIYGDDWKRVDFDIEDSIN